MIEAGEFWRRLFWVSVALSLLPAFPAAGSDPAAGAGFRRASRLPDLSGLAWVGGDVFLAVHDAKNPEEKNLPRVSLLELPAGLEGIVWKPLEVKFPGGQSNDFESADAIPGAQGVLLVESTEEQAEKPFSRRIFLARFVRHQLRIVDAIEWPVTTENVEGTAVARTGERLIFIFAERAQGQGSTVIRFADLELEPLAIGDFQDAGVFTSPGPTGPHARPVTAMEVDGAGRLYVATAEDPGDDNGPFRSAVYRIGQVVLENGEPQLVLEDEPVRLAVLDGLKVESVAVRERPGEDLELFAGLDDENYGGTLRPIPLEQP